MAKAVKALMDAAGRARQPTSELLAVLRQNTPGDADYRSALAELKRRLVFYDALDQYMKAIRVNLAALPDEEEVGNEAYCKAEAESNARILDARSHFENIIYTCDD
jgi:hypothetical protein